MTHYFFQTTTHNTLEINDLKNQLLDIFQLFDNQRVISTRNTHITKQQQTH